MGAGAGARGAFAGRENLVERTDEAWRPPFYGAPAGRLQGIVNSVRRFFDLQAGSIWRDLAPALKGMRGTLVDAGCGAQPYRPLLARDVEYIGIDIVEAKAWFGYASAGVRYYSGGTWPVADSSADVVLVTETLEHVSDPEAFLREAHRCLKPGGEIVLTVPFAARWHFVPHDYWRFTPSSLALLLDHSGFGEIRVFARGNAFTVSMYKAITLVFPLLLPQGQTWPRRTAKRVVGIVGVPLVVAGALAGNLSLRWSGGGDWLGLTAVAQRAAA